MTTSISLLLLSNVSYFFKSFLSLEYVPLRVYIKALYSKVTWINYFCSVQLCYCFDTCWGSFVSVCIQCQGFSHAFWIINYFWPIEIPVKTYPPEKEIIWKRLISLVFKVHFYTRPPPKIGKRHRDSARKIITGQWIYELIAPTSLHYSEKKIRCLVITVVGHTVSPKLMLA